MSASIKDIKEAIYEWIKAYVPCDIQVIEANPNAKRPKTPYVTFLLKSFVKVGQDSIEFSSGTSYKIGGQRRLTCSIVIYGDNCQQMAFDLQASLETITGLDMLRRAGLAVWNEPSIADISMELDTGIERRMNLDVIFGFGTSLVEDVGIIETVEAEGTFDASGQTITTESTITL